jgi:hypothetical protein
MTGEAQSYSALLDSRPNLPSVIRSMLARHKTIRFTVGANEYLSNDDACNTRFLPISSSARTNCPEFFECGAHVPPPKRETGMPNTLALSTRFSVMPEPGKTTTPIGIV